MILTKLTDKSEKESKNKGICENVKTLCLGNCYFAIPEY